VFRLMLPATTRIELTQIEADIAGDTHVPPFGPEWREVSREDHEADGATPAYAFITLERAA
jgi:dihydrofolate reductase